MILIKKVIALSVAAIINLSNNIQVKPDPIPDPIKIRCTCYLDTGITASGVYTRKGIMAGKKEWLGCVAEVNAINEDGTIGEFIGYYEILDTGYGMSTGRGQSKVKKGKAIGTIEAGESVDIWMPSMSQAKEWINTYGDYVYIRVFRGKG